MRKRHTPGARELLCAGLARAIEADGRSEAEIGEALGLGATPSAAASNLRKYVRGERWPSAAMLDRLVQVLGVEHVDFFRRPP